jgi:hypothetical protein
MSKADYIVPSRVYHKQCILTTGPENPVHYTVYKSVWKILFI